MRKHNGMRPQDVAILLKIVAREGEEWQLASLASSLLISLSEISESLNRSKLAGLVDQTKKKVNRQNLMEFLEYGVKYVFPQQPGTMMRGMPTAHSHPHMKNTFASDLPYVWPDSDSDTLGLIIEPLYSRQATAAKQDEQFYKLLALVDVIRVGRVREVKHAIKELGKMILHEK